MLAPPFEGTALSIATTLGALVYIYIYTYIYIYLRRCKAPLQRYSLIFQNSPTLPLEVLEDYLLY